MRKRKKPIFAYLSSLEGFEDFNVSKAVVGYDLIAVLVHAKKCSDPELSPGFTNVKILKRYISNQ